MIPNTIIAEVPNVKKDNINIFDKNTSTDRRLRGLYLMTEIIQKKWKGDLHQEEMFTYERFRSQLIQKAIQMG